MRSLNKLVSWAFLVIGLMAARGQAQSYSFRDVAGNPAAGSTDGTNATAQFHRPSGIAVDSQGNIYVADQENYTIRKITPVGTNWGVTTIAGKANTANFNRVQDGTNSSALFNFPTGVAVDGWGNLYVADQQNNAIRLITPAGTNWVVTTIGGQGPNNPNFADGTNTASLFSGPTGIAVDASSNVFVADQYNYAIRKITPIAGTTNWVVTTIAGSPTNYGSGDGTNAGAQFNGPTGVAVDAGGTLYVADQPNNTIRKVTHSGTNWIVTTLAGHLRPGSTDGTNTGLFDGPSSVAVDASGNLYVADDFNSAIRRIAPLGSNWVTTTLGGRAGVTGTNNGAGTNALFYYPFGVAVDAFGNLLVADSVNNTIRIGSTPASGMANLLVGLGFVTNGFALNYYGIPGSNYTLLESPDFASWTPVENFTCTTLPELLVDPGATSMSNLFYRVEQGTVAIPGLIKMGLPATRPFREK
jgi:streptogramin lyase